MNNEARYRTMSSTIDTIVYKPQLRGLDRFFGPLESSIMRYLWSVDSPQTTAQIIAAIDCTREYSTIMTTISRLADKGLLKSAPTVPRRVNSLVFSATVDSETFYRLAVRSIINALLEDCPDLLSTELSKARVGAE
jgi:predicted transcriptional regulator